MKISNISRIKSRNLNVSRPGLQLPLHDILKPCVKPKIMLLEQRRQAMLQLHLSDQGFNCLLNCVLCYRLDGISDFIIIEMSTDIVVDNYWYKQRALSGAINSWYSNITCQFCMNPVRSAIWILSKQLSQQYWCVVYICVYFSVFFFVLIAFYI